MLKPKTDILRISCEVARKWLPQDLTDAMTNQHCFRQCAIRQLGDNELKYRNGCLIAYQSFGYLKTLILNLSVSKRREISWDDKSSGFPFTNID